MKIEPVTIQTFTQAARVYALSWRDSHRTVCSSEFLERRDCEGYLRERTQGLYLIRDREPVGVFRLNDGFLSDLYIHPGYAGKGWGSACVAFAKGLYPRLRLTVLSSNENAIRFYEKNGFRFTGRDVLLRDGLWEREMEYTEKDQ